MLWTDKMFIERLNEHCPTREDVIELFRAVRDDYEERGKTVFQVKKKPTLLEQQNRWTYP